MRTSVKKRRKCKNCGSFLRSSQKKDFCSPCQDAGYGRKANKFAHSEEMRMIREVRKALSRAKEAS